MVGRWQNAKSMFFFKRNFCIFMFFLIITLNFTNISVKALDDKPDLRIKDYELPENIVEGDEVEFIVEIENIVNEDTGEFADIPENTEIVVALYIDSVVVTTNNTLDGLEVNESTFVNLNWIAELGSQPQRNVRIEVNPSFLPNRIPESRYINNFRLDSIIVFEKDPELTITDVDFPENILVNKHTTIIATIKNNGGATNKPIYAKLNSSLQGEIDNDTRIISLQRDKTHNFTFNWIPEYFGTQVISIDIIYDNKTHEYREISVIVEMGILQWWNDNWHYRYILSVDGSGTVKSNINFTAQLNALGILSKTFENETIRIVQYHRNGSIIREVNEYFFNESSGYDPINNATGHLIWRVSGSTFEKFFCIYFDVKENIGIRNSSMENETLSESGNAEIGQFSYVEGWWINIIRPINGSFALINENVNINITTNAKALTVSAFIYFDEDESHNFSIGFNNDNNTEWFNSTNLFDREGYWTIVVSGQDDVGYKPKDVIQSLFIGKPDLKIENITIKTIRDPSSSDIYIDDIVNFSADVSGINATVENVKISLKILDNEDTIYTDHSNITIFKDKKTHISFEWIANITGTFNVSITIDPDDLIDEKNESNNVLMEEIVISAWPDLSVERIIFPAFVLMEFDRVEIGIVIKNYGLGDANNYILNLFIEPANRPMDFSENDKVDNTSISLASNTTKTYSLYWGSAVAGSWQVAAIVIYNDTKKDTNETNNVLRSVELLNIDSYERNPPNIIITDIDPRNQIQGGSVTIHANITDDTGIKTVTIEISYNTTFQSELLINDSMERIGDNIFVYTFSDTLNIGKYEIEITAIDLSVHENIAKRKGNFQILKDSVPPTIISFSANPEVQLIGKNVEINCIVNDNVDIKSVKVNITHIPTSKSYSKDMTISPYGVYTNIDWYDDPGIYIFYIIAEDYSDNIVTNQLEPKFFWITTDLSDSDNDGMSDVWEEEYGLNPRNPDDALIDSDDDGIINLDEFENNGNPKKNIFSENVAYRIKENIGYLAGSVVLFIILFILTLIGIRRR